MDKQPASLSADDQALLVRSMLLAADSELFPDWEFHTIFGVQRNDVRQVAMNWPVVEGISNEVVEDAALNSLNNLLGYPHRRADWVEHKLGVKLSALESLWDRTTAFFKAQGGGHRYGGRPR